MSSLYDECLRDAHDRERKRAERCKEVAGQLIGGNVNEAEVLIRLPAKDFILGRRMGQTVFVRFSEPDVS